MGEENLVFGTTLALAELPYFERGEGDRLVLAEPGLGPVVDVHTHLALTCVRHAAVDLWREHARTEHYLPVERDLDLDIYANRNLTRHDIKRMKRDLTLAGATRSGLRRTHTAANLLREMGELGIAASVLLPIDFPCLSWNAEAYLAVAAIEPALVSLGSVHPYARDVAGRLARQKELGARGIKVHPAAQLVAPDNRRAMKLYRLCADLDLPVLWHCGPVGIEPRLARRLCQLKRYRPAVRENPHTVFILGHSGALQMEMALELALHYPNVYLDVSNQSLTSVRRIIAEAPADRVLFGSDWPFYHQAVALAKVLIATDGCPPARRRVLWENAARLFHLDEPKEGMSRVSEN